MLAHGLVLVERLVAVHVAAFEREQHLPHSEDVGQRQAHVGAARPRVGVVRVEARTSVQTLDRHVVAEAVDAADTLERGVDAQLAVLEAAEDESVAELVEDVAHEDLEVPVGPLDVLRREVELLVAGLFTELIALQCRKIGVGLDARREVLVGVVQFEVVVRSEVILHLRSDDRIVHVVDRVRLETARQLTLSQLDLGMRCGHTAGAGNQQCDLLHSISFC